MRYTISLDWLQLFCENTSNKRPVLDTYLTGRFNCFKGYKYQYHVVECKEKNFQYREGFSIMLNKVTLMHIHYSPASSAIRQNAVSIKINNPILYTNQWHFYLMDVVACLGLKIVSITRADVCMDFNKFANGWHPKSFIRRYNNRNDIIRKGSNKFCIIGSKGAAQTNYEYLRFGSRLGACSAYLYNKTLELRTKKYKPWIVKTWEDAGLNPDDTWRLELSIQNKGLKLRNEDGKVRKLCVDDLAALNNLQQVFFLFAKQYWSFRQYEGQKFRKDMKEIPLLPMDKLAEVVERPSFLKEFADTGRSERSAAKSIERVAFQCADLYFDERIHMAECAKIMNRIASLKRINHVCGTLRPAIDYYLSAFPATTTQSELLKLKSATAVRGCESAYRAIMQNYEWRS